MIRVAQTTENAKMRVFWWRTEKTLVRCDCACGLTWVPIDKISGGGEGLRLERGWRIGMEKHGADAIIQRAQRAQHALGLAVLCRRVRAREAQRNAIVLEEFTQREVIELTPIVSLET